MGTAKKIVVFNDDQFLLYAFIEMLVFLGHDVVPQLDASKVVACVKQAKPALVILDLCYDRSNCGLEVLKDIRRNPEFHNLPVIFTSAISPSIEISEVFLETPFDLSQLEELVNNYLS